MARRYSRDNRGRFAGSGGGATARGGRLKTASGNKRKTQTMQSAAAPKGTIGKPRGVEAKDCCQVSAKRSGNCAGRKREARYAQLEYCNET